MRLFSLVIGYVLFSSLLQADIYKYSVEDFYHVRFEGDEAERVYRAFNLDDTDWREGKGRVFLTSRDSIELYCFNRHYNVIPYACHFTFDLRGLKKDVKFKAEGNYFRLILTEEKDIQSLKEALLENPLVVGNEDVVVECTDEACGVKVKLK